MLLTPSPEQIAWIIAADMGLGHQRAAYPLKDLGGGKIITAGSTDCSSVKEVKLWKNMQSLYESLSRINHIPIIGGFLFGLLEKLESITPYYPFRDLSSPTIQVKYLLSLIRKGLGETLVETLRETDLPIVSTFFAIAHAADYLNYPKVFLIATDTDLNRVWVSADPKKSNIIYFAPCSHVLRRLKEYGVPDEKIFLTGFPLPKENLGSPDLEVLKFDLGQRLNYLDPSQRFWSLHRVEVEHYLTPQNCVNLKERKLSLTFAIGGAGAQLEIGDEVLKSLSRCIHKGCIRLNLVAGVRSEVKDHFEKAIRKLGLQEKYGTDVTILYYPTKEEYFPKFNQLLRTTDILWTKPSELSFYCGLGLPVIIAPPLGSHEHYNKKWLIDHRAGIPQEDPSLCSEWLFDYINEGLLAQAAWDGFLNTRKYGTYKIEEILRTGTMSRDPSPLKR